MPVVQTLNFAVIVAFYAAAGTGFLAGHHAKRVITAGCATLSDGLVAL